MIPCLKAHRYRRIKTLFPGIQTPGINNINAPLKSESEPNNRFRLKVAYILTRNMASISRIFPIAVENPPVIPPFCSTDQSSRPFCKDSVEDQSLSLLQNQLLGLTSRSGTSASIASSSQLAPFGL
jgi:hypothetical protein